MSIENRKVNHPEFRSVMDNGAAGYPVVVFERSGWYKPTDAQIEDYRRREQAVRILGGVMMVSEWQIAGERTGFTKKDIRSMRKAVLAALPEYVIRDEWNGEGCLSASFSIKKRNS